MSKPYSASMGYGTDWYPKNPPVIPRVYHEYIKDENKDNLYSPEELGKNIAYFCLNLDKYPVFCYNDTMVKSIVEGPEKAKLLPGSITENTVSRKVSVTNTGESDAYVRVFLAIPKYLDDAIPTFNASYNMLHFNMDKDISLVKGCWNWSTSMNRPELEPVNNANCNHFETLIDCEEYNVYVVTYESVLKPGESTVDAIYQVYLDKDANDADLQQVFDILRTNEWDIKVAVESTSVEEFEDPFSAFEFKVTGTYDPFDE